MNGLSKGEKPVKRWIDLRFESKSNSTALGVFDDPRYGRKPTWAAALRPK